MGLFWSCVCRSVVAGDPVAGCQPELHILFTKHDHKMAGSRGSSRQTRARKQDECATAPELHIHPVPGRPPGRETVGTTPPTPPGLQDECATRPHATSRHHDLPPGSDHPRPHTTCTLPQPGSKHLRPDPYRTTQPADTPTRKPTPTAHLRPHPHNQAPYPDHATGGHLMRPGRRRPSRQRGPVRPPRGTFCAQGNRLRRKQPRFVTFCAKRHPVHKMSRPAQNVPPHHPHPRGRPRPFLSPVGSQATPPSPARPGAPTPANRPYPVHARGTRTARDTPRPAPGNRVVATFPEVGSSPALPGP